MKKKYQTKTTEAFKVLVKRKVRYEAFKELEVKYIKHTSLINPQSYLVSDQLDNKAKADLFNLRSESHRSFKDNFHNMFDSNDCPMCGKDTDSQMHALSCEVVAQHLDKEEQNILNHISYSDIFSTIDKQVVITHMFQKIISIRKKKINPPSNSQAPHGIVVDLVDIP